MIEFKACEGDADVRVVHIDPNHVASVVETGHRRGGDWVPLAVIRMADGQEHTVYDSGRTVAKAVAAAKGSPRRVVT